ncbi:unnamed protein product, partial [Laminaria digitata]
SDDFLSWLLVNADSIDPNLIFNESDLPFEGLLSENGEASATAAAAGDNQPPPSASDEVSVTTLPPQLSNEFIIDQSASPPPQQQQQQLEPPPPVQQQQLDQQQQLEQGQGAQSVLAGVGGTVPATSSLGTAAAAFSNPTLNLSAAPAAAGDAPLPTAFPAWVRAGSAEEEGVGGAGAFVISGALVD